MREVPYMAAVAAAPAAAPPAATSARVNLDILLLGEGTWMHDKKDINVLPTSWYACDTSSIIR